MQFGGGLEKKCGRAVDVVLNAPDREGEQQNWHAHLLATTRKVTAGALAEKCEIEPSGAKRLSLGLAPVRIEIEAVRQMLAEEVNRQLTEGRRPERVNQVTLGWKVVQMECRGAASECSGQLNRYRPTMSSAKLLSSIPAAASPAPGGRARTAAQVRAEESDRGVQTVFRGQGPIHREAILKCWRDLATSEVLDVANARAWWEQNQGNRQRQGLAPNPQDDRVGDRPNGHDTRPNFMKMAPILEEMRPHHRGGLRGVSAAAP